MNKLEENKPFVWNINIPILKNPLLWYQLFVVASVVCAFMLILLLEANLFQNQWEAIPSSVLTAIIIGGGFFIVFSLVLFIIYVRGIPTTYVLNDKSIEQYTLNKEKKTFSFLSLLGIASGKNVGFTAAGASLLARSRERIAVNWKDIYCVENYPNLHEIRLKNEWRTVMQVVCPKDQFDSILEVIKNQTQTRKQSSNNNQANEPSFAKKIILSLMILICGSFLFVRLPIHYVGFFTIATIAMAFASLWSEGAKKKIFAAILTFTPMIAVIAAFAFKEVDMSKAGSVYALIIELISISFFLLLGAKIFFKRVH